jgi:hypothetical protein
VTRNDDDYDNNNNEEEENNQNKKTEGDKITSLRRTITGGEERS